MSKKALHIPAQIFRPYDTYRLRQNDLEGIQIAGKIPRIRKGSGHDPQMRREKLLSRGTEKEAALKLSNPTLHEITEYLAQACNEIGDVVVGKITNIINCWENAHDLSQNSLGSEQYQPVRIPDPLRYSLGLFVFFKDESLPVIFFEFFEKLLRCPEFIHEEIARVFGCQV